jgi:HD domain-containing protein
MARSEGSNMDQPTADLRGIGADMVRAPGGSAPAERLPDVPGRPTLQDIFRLRLFRRINNLPFAPGKHMIQAATLARRANADEETILACLLHDIGFAVARPDHGWWSAQLVEPYVSERVSWAIRHHQALRFYPDPSVNYEYPQMYVQMFGANYQPPSYIEAAYRSARNHPWYMHARLITLFDDYSFDPDAEPDLEAFGDIIGRHFRQPEEGLGQDGSPVAHMWRLILDPTRPL